MRRRENLKLQQFHCPSCGQNITQLTPFKASIECPYCHHPLPYRAMTLAR